MIQKTEENTSFIINETLRANSCELGKAGARFKLYFDNAIDLNAQIEDLKKIGVWKEDEQPKA